MTASFATCGERELPEHPLTATVGFIANPHAGKDIRRLVAHASPTSDVAKMGIMRRAALGAVAGGATRLVVAPDGHRLAERAVDDLGVEVRVDLLDEPVTGTSDDTIAMAGRMAKEDAGAVIVLGGDGTSRDVAKGWLDVTLMPVSTGTNNVFPRLVEGTVAGLAAGLVASGAVPRAHATYQADVIHVSFDDGSDDELALVDVALVDGHFIGARAVWDMRELREVVACIAEPSNVGLSALAAQLHPVHRHEPGGVHVRLGQGRSVTAALAPGMFVAAGVQSSRLLADGESVQFTGPGVMAFDGERDRVLASGVTATLTIRRDGPHVIEVDRTLTAAARAHHFERS